MKRSLTPLLILCFFLLCRTTHLSLACQDNERQALLTFKQSLQDTCNLLSDWRGVNCCKWREVGCDKDTGHVIKLSIGHLITGQFPVCPISSDTFDRSLSTLKYLQHLDLSNVAFSPGNIPQFIGSFASLRHLNISGTSRIGKIPHNLGDLKYLKYLDFSDISSNLVADSLQWLSHLSSLMYLDMSGVNLTRATDWVLSVQNLPSLSVLKLSSCNLPSPLTSALNTNTSSITTLDLSQNKFRDGTVIDRFLLSLSSSLVNLDLSYCSMYEPFPRSLKNLTSLKVLDLSANNFNGSLPESLGELSQLESLDVHSNFLHGLIPRILSHLCNLHRLVLSRNNFVGDMSRMLPGQTRCKRYSLEELDMSFNQLNGSLPDWIWHMQDLSMLDLSYNALGGVISDLQFANMTKLKTLSLSGNGLIFNTSSAWVPPFKLNTIDLRSCRMGPRFPSWLKTQRGFDYLDISDAGILDRIPSWFPNASYAADYLNISYNQIRGEISTSLKFLSATIIDMSSNLFEGKLPLLNASVRSILLGHNLFSGDTRPILNAEMLNLRDIILSQNLLSGEIPSAICNLSSMQLIDLSNNYISGKIPECQSYNDSLLLPYVINLANNHLNGSIPPWMAGPVPHSVLESNLIVLRLNNNSFHGEIPSFLRYCNSMTILDLGENKLTGNIPSWIGEGLSSLRFLRMRSNMLTGKIPLQLSYLTSLQVLDLAQNKLSGAIPHSFKNFTAMTEVNRTVEGIVNYIDGASHLVEIASSKFEEIVEVEVKGRQLEYTKTLSLVMVLDLSCNNLSGEIPIELMDLIGLQSLNLSKNQLEGNIPDKLGRMIQLEALDLSINHLSGKIPGSITLLTSLSYLNLSYNYLSGRIPSGNQIQTLTDPSIYAGNGRLCGFPLPKCPGDEHSRPPIQGVDAEDEDSDSDMLELYLSMGIGFVAGWWVICATFIFKNSWRVACFQYYDNMENKFMMTMDSMRRKIFLAHQG